MLTCDGCVLVMTLFALFGTCCVMCVCYSFDFADAQLVYMGLSALSSDAKVTRACVCIITHACAQGDMWIAWLSSHARTNRCFGGAEWARAQTHTPHIHTRTCVFR